jgi:hypothetical protein
MIDLGAHIGDIARRFLGEPNRALSTRHQLRFGNNGSIAVEIAGAKRGQWFDHENGVGGGAWQLIRLKGDIGDADIPTWLEREFGIRRDDSFIDCTYDYCDEEGRLLFQVCRLYPKTFRQRRPDGIWKVAGIRQVPYRLCDLAIAVKKANGSPPRVYVVEGEKDADRLARWGLIATTNPGGAGKWRPEFNRYFTGCDAVIIPDNDPAGAAHATTVATNLLPVAASVRVVELGGLPEKGDISDWIDDGGSQTDLETLVELARPLSPAEEQKGSEPNDNNDVWEMDDEPIPPRGWLLGNTFCREFLSSLIADGGVGKTALRIAQYLSCATGRSLTGEHVFVRCRVLVISLEDGKKELKRRVRAAMLHHGITSADIKGWLFLWTPKGIRLMETDERGKPVTGDLDQQICEQIVLRKIDLLGLDPLVKTHNVDENNNQAMDTVVGMLAARAQELDVAADTVHHTRKGPGDPGNADLGRGASAVKDAARIVDTLTPMSREEAQLFNVSDRERKLLIRLDNGKANLTPKAADARWFKLVGVRLGNSTDLYPHGDEVQTVECWTPPDTWAGLTYHMLNQILSDIDAGLSDSNRYTDGPNVGDRAAWRVIVKHAPTKTEAQAREIIKIWAKNGVLIRYDYTNPVTRKAAKGFRVDDAKRPS